jgi:hypothetical protein
MLTLVVLGAVLAIGAGGLLAVVTSDDGDPSSSGSSETTPPSGTTDPAPEEADRITLGDTDYVNPCRLLTGDDVARLFGDLGDDGYVTQEYLDSSMSTGQFHRETDSLTGAVSTSCDYAYGDADVTSLKVQVDSYRTPKRAAAEWASIAYLGTGKESKKLAKDSYDGGFGFVVQLARENERNMGGDPVAGARKSLLYVAGRQSFVAYGSNVVVTLHYGPAINVFVDSPLSAAEYRSQAPKMVKAAAVVQRRLAQPDLDQTSLPPYLDDETSYADGVPYLDACALLDAEVYESLLGETPDPVATSTSLPADPAARRRRNDTLLGQTGSNSCERRTYRKDPRAISGRSWSANLEIRYAPATEDAPELLEQHVVQRSYEGRAERTGTMGSLASAGFLTLQRETDADLFVIIDSTVQTGRKDRFAQAYFNVGPYSLRLDAQVPRGSYDWGSPTAARYRAAVELLVAKVRALSADLEDDAG